MITDRDPGDECDGAAIAERQQDAERDRVLSLVANTGALSEWAMKRLYEMQLQHHQGRRHERPKLRRVA